MITTRTVFVVGAGAGVPYGFPTGYQLRTEIRNGESRIHHSQHLPAVADSLGLYPSPLSELKEALWATTPRSIDSLLVEREDLLDVGKVAIAATLLPYERSVAMYAETVRQGEVVDRGDWIGFLLDRVFGEGQTVSPAVSFVTFNYDRLLEHRLTTMAAALWRLEPTEAWARIRDEVEIVHVYGSLGEYSPEPSDRTVHWTLNGGPSAARADRVREAVESISLVHERSDETDQVTRAKEIIGQAERVWFLGFGFDETNMSRLRATMASNKLIGSPIYGSTYGMLKGEQTVARKLITKNLTQSTRSAPKIDVGYHNLVDGDCLTALRTHADALS